MNARRRAWEIRVQGRVQGVGFRPFVYGLAHQLGLCGSVCNQGSEVLIHLEGLDEDLQRFLQHLSCDAPSLARLDRVIQTDAPLRDVDRFVVLPSLPASGAATGQVPPDLYACPDCLHELRTPGNRRYHYPFINCTQCGPRYTLMHHLPYDRAATAMRDFRLCAQCQREYEDPSDRRFHAEPTACPRCGPRLWFRDAHHRLDEQDTALAAAVDCLRAGGILAVKGLGGYHLMVVATDTAAVTRLRARKRRPDKPLAVMFPEQREVLGDSVDLDDDSWCLLQSPVRPILLLPRKPSCPLPALLAPGLDELGVLLPYSPLHALLSEALGTPLVATSANLSGEPVLTRTEDADTDLEGIADAWLHHNRPILRPADDSVLRRVVGRFRPVRLGRGMAPLDMTLPGTLQHAVLATGGHQKNTLALGWAQRAVISPHLSDLHSPRALDTLAQVAGDLQVLHNVPVHQVLHDAHPGYGSTRWARQQPQTTSAVGHHRAHASALVGEAWQQGITAQRWLIMTWDGVGLGDDGMLWGGETWYGAPGQWQRVASLHPYRLPGGDKASREPWRSALGLRWEAGMMKDILGVSPSDYQCLLGAWQRGLNCPLSSAAGRLFDAAWVGITGQRDVSYEAQAPMQLEALARGDNGDTDQTPLPTLPLYVDDQGLLRLDWRPLLMLMDNATLPPAQRARLFHHALAEGLVQTVMRLRKQLMFDAVGLTGGVFQNSLLVEQVQQRLSTLSMPLILPELLPCNDAGLAYGQLVEYVCSDARVSAREMGSV